LLQDIGICMAHFDYLLAACPVDRH